MAMPSPRMATQYTFYCQQSAFKWAVFFYRLNAILRTSWSISAGIWQKRGNKILVKPDYQRKKE